MADDPTQPESAEKQLGEIVAEVSSKASLLVREEIELAKAEVAQKAKRLGIGAGLLAVAGLFMFFFLIFLLHMLAWGFVDWFGFNIWVGYGLVCILLLVFAGLLALIALRAFKKGSPPVPKMAIEEAKKTREAIGEARR
jgi:uncharacterized membrane protein YqjE